MELLSTTFVQSQEFWTAVAFFVLLGVIARFVAPAVAAVLDARAAQIKGDLDSANKLRAEAEKVMADYQAQLAKARKEAGDIVSKARADAEALAAERVKQAEAEISRKAEDARKSIDAAKAQALREVQAEVAGVAVQVAETLLAEKVDAKQAAKLTDAALKRGMN
jgi:F-type H+-transporting ATPase subunit b